MVSLIEGKTCVVTGAAGAIGTSIARTLLAAGGSVVGLDSVPVDGAYDELRCEDRWRERFVAVHCDVTSPAQLEVVAADVVERHGGCHVVVNNAAVIRSGAILDLAPEDWQYVLDVNLNGYFHVARAFGPHMAKETSSSMIHISSLAGQLGQPFSGAYSVSKAAIVMLSKVLAVELGPRGVRSNVVSPAMLNTPLSAAFYEDPAIRAKREAMVPLSRIGTSQDMADAVLYLASDQSSYVSGQEIVVDGGLGAGWLGTVPRPGFQRSE
jgi:NAD(P)-dependent dehydrogenase (short-subunit alcohol dehydrogenase family)